MIELKKHSIQSIKDAYREIYISVFGTWVEVGNCPADVYVGFEEEKYSGFLAGYPIGPGSWYLQSGGFINESKKRIRNLRTFIQCLEILHEEWNYISTKVRNDDFPTLRISLAAGFKIIGTEIDTDGNLWVQLIHLKEVIENG